MVLKYETQPCRYNPNNLHLEARDIKFYHIYTLFIAGLSNSNELVNWIQAAGFLASQMTHLQVWTRGLLSTVPRAVVLPQPVAQALMPLQLTTRLCCQFACRTGTENWKFSTVAQRPVSAVGAALIHLTS